MEMPAGVIIPSSAVAIMARLIRRTKPERVSLRRAGPLFEIGTEAFAFTTRVIDAIFPDYRRVIPDGPHPAVATCEAPPLVAALTRLSAIASAGRALNLVALAWSSGAARVFLPRQPDDGADALAAAGTEGTAQIALSLPAFAALVAEFDGLLRLEVEEGRALVIRDDSYKLGVLTSCRWNWEAAAPADWPATALGFESQPNRKPMNDLALMTTDGFAVQENSGASMIIGRMLKFTDGRFTVDKTETLPASTTLVAVGVITRLGKMGR